MRADRRALLLIVLSRALSEGVGLAVAAAILHSLTNGRDPIPLLAASAGLTGVTLVLAAMLRERGTVRQSAALTAAVMVGSIAWGLAQPARDADALAVLTRVVAFGILGEVQVWRTLGIARGLQRWGEVRDDALLSLGAIVAASIAGGPVDRAALPALGLTVACAGAVALSLARSHEELTLSGGAVRGTAAPSSATGSAFALGVLALLLAMALPWLEPTTAQVARTVGPLLGGLVFAILLPLGYVAAYLVYLVQWLADVLRPGPVRIVPPQSPFDPSGDQERLRELEQLRPFVFGAVELLVALVALVFAAALIARLVQERRAAMPEGASLEREHVDGIGMGEMLRALFPRMTARARAPADDGSAATALRRLYWRLLDLAERDGPGRRAPAETPAEHERRLVSAAGRWAHASSLVRSFESLRYGERDVDRATLERARQALARVEAAR